MADQDRQIGIKVENVSKRFGDFLALDDVTLDVPEGSLTALLGPSGSGKSTLLRLIAGLEHADSGRVLLGGSDVTGVPVQERGIGFVFQHYAAFKHMTVRDNIAFGLKIRKSPRDQIRDRVKELIRLVQLQGMAHRYPSQLSGGQRQRMALARALAAEPKLLLLDEPFGALDATVRKELRTWLRHLHDEVSVTTIFVTHDPEEALDVAEQIVVMNDGKIEQVGAPRELYAHPKTEFVMGFVGEVNRFGNALIRPHDLDLGLVKVDGSEEAMIERVSHLGFEVRVELSMASGDRAWAQVTRAEAEELELEQGQIICARPSRARVFEGEDGPPTAPTDELQVA
jgi:sulfate transport system ATP-binding protein